MMAYGFGKGKRKPKQKKMMKRYYKRNKTDLKRQQKKRYDRYSPVVLERPGGVNKTKRKQYKDRDYPSSINQPRRLARELCVVANLILGDSRFGDSPDHPLRH